MGPFDRHVFVCVSGRTCPRQGADAVFQALRVRVKEAGITDRVRINKAGCFAQCGYGPLVAVYPENVWYAAFRPEDVPRLVDQHLIGGRPLADRRHDPGGRGKQICPPGGEPIPPEDRPT